MLTDDQITDWRDLRDRLDAAQETIAAAVRDGRRLTSEDAGEVLQTLDDAKANLDEEQRAAEAEKGETT